MLVDTTKLQQNFIKEVYKACSKGNIIPKYHYMLAGDTIYIVNSKGTAMYHTDFASWCLSLEYGEERSKFISKLIPASYDKDKMCNPTGIFKISQKGQAQEFVLDGVKIYLDSKLLATFGKDVVLTASLEEINVKSGRYYGCVAVWDTSGNNLGVIMPVKVN